MKNQGGKKNKGIEMEDVTEELLSLISNYKSKLQKLNSEEWGYQNAPDKWTKKEILGHLIDSAANNHQRFVRTQHEENLQITYNQNIWVKVQNYKFEDVEILIELWYYYNLHLINVIKNIPKEKYNRETGIKKEELVTLGWLANDYLRHLQHHLNQIIIE